MLYEQGKRLRGRKPGEKTLKRKRNQLNTLRRHFDHGTFAVPGTQYDAMDWFAVGKKGMNVRAVGMTVD